MKWDSSQYLQFQGERTRPAIDLAQRVPIDGCQNIVDIGCGPGNSSAILKKMYPTAAVLGIDHSENMIKKAQATYDNIEFRVLDVQTKLNGLGKKFDLVFSNACLQWIPDHRNLLKTLFSIVADGGVMAVQIPKNGDSPLYRALDEVVNQPKWNFAQQDVAYNGTLKPEEYFDILSGLTTNFNLWETIYYHRMANHKALLEWVKGTRLRPYMSLLNAREKAMLEEEIIEKVIPYYPVQANGEIIYPFRRLFFTAKKEVG